MRFRILAICCFLSTGTTAHADAVDGAFYTGDFYLARSLGQSENSEHSLMTACRAGMIIGGYFETGSTAVESLHQAYQDCHKVSQLNPTHVNARITLAIITGFEGKRWRNPGLAKKSKRLLETLVTEFPSSAPAYAALGGWHSEVSAAGFLPKLYLGAKRSDAMEYFSAAKKMGASDLPFTLEYLKFLARGNNHERNLALAIALSLKESVSLSALNQIMLKKISGIERALVNKDKNMIKKAITEATAFKNIENWRDVPPIAFMDRAGGETN